MEIDLGHEAALGGVRRALDLGDGSSDSRAGSLLGLDIAGRLLVGEGRHDGEQTNRRPKNTPRARETREGAGGVARRERMSQRKSGELADYCPRPLTPFIPPARRLDWSQSRKIYTLTCVPHGPTSQITLPLLLTGSASPSKPESGAPMSIMLGQQMPGDELGTLFAVGRG